MTKLLDFGELFAMEYIKDAVAEDAQMSCTPDTPALRYAGPQLVFLWDDLRYVNEKSHPAFRGADVENYSAVSRESFVPLRMRFNNKQEYDRWVLPVTSGFLAKTEGVSDEVKAMTTAPVQGRILKVGLATMNTLDSYMGNTHMSRRIKLDFFVNNYRPVREVVRAWAYVTPPSMFTKYDPHEGVYRLGHQGEILPVRTINITAQNKKTEDTKVYSVMYENHFNKG